jgi:Uncharacterized protein, possibly involved in aromatic compounds catabolism
MEFTSFGAQEVVLRCNLGAQHARPGGTISGPVMMALADVVAYACILARNPAAKSSVTVGFNVHFFRRPAPEYICAHGRIMKMGKRLAFMDITLFQEDIAYPVGQVTCSYAVAEGDG